MSSQKHTLYIQMQLCSQKNLGDFLGDPKARKGTSTQMMGSSLHTNEIDIPYALRLFSQIARGVKYVHQQGLIHRDLKPSNCFIDEVGNVKVGDFGLSRESAATGGLGKLNSSDDEDDQYAENRRKSLGGGDDNTAGVGTRSYASPEQMSGSDYDKSTDVYSLGIMLFELCYPMYTGMERHMVFKGIRKRTFPEQWHETVAVAFPTLHALLMKMLSSDPSERPTSADVANHIDGLLGEYTVLSLDRTHRREGSVLLRVEAIESEGVLRRTTQMIKDADSNLTILQYGLRGHESKAIMEFALTLAEDTEDRDVNDTTTRNDAIKKIIKVLEKNEDITVVRQVTEKHIGLERGNSIGLITNGGAAR